MRMNENGNRKTEQHSEWESKMCKKWKMISQTESNNIVHCDIVSWYKDCVIIDPKGIESSVNWTSTSSNSQGYIQGQLFSLTKWHSFCISFFSEFNVSKISCFPFSLFNFFELFFTISFVESNLYYWCISSFVYSLSLLFPNIEIMLIQCQSFMLFQVEFSSTFEFAFCLLGFCLFIVTIVLRFKLLYFFCHSMFSFLCRIKFNWNWFLEFPFSSICQQTMKCFFCFKW